MQGSNQAYRISKSNAGNEVDLSIAPKPGILLRVLTYLIVLINIGLNIILLEYPAGFKYEHHNLPLYLGYIFAGSVLLPFIAILLFQPHKRYRNSRARYKIFFWSSWIMLLSGFMRLLELAA